MLGQSAEKVKEDVTQSYYDLFNGLIDSSPDLQVDIEGASDDNSLQFKPEALLTDLIARINLDQDGED